MPPRPPAPDDPVHDAAPPPPASRPDRRAIVLLWARRVGFARLLVVALVALLVGTIAGRMLASGPDGEAQGAVETTVLPLVVDADGIWTSSSDDRPPVAEALLALREGDARLVESSIEDWRDAYDAVLVRLAGLDLPSAARPVQREFITGVTLSRDAMEVLAHAATIDDPDHRRDLVTEASRLRQRSEQVVQGARASTLDLAGERSDVAPLPSLPSFLDGRRG